MKAEKKNDRQIVLERSFATPAEKVFRALTEPERLKSWLSSPEMQLVAAEADFRAGGAWRFIFQRKSGRKLEVRGHYHEVEPGRCWTNSESYDFSPLEVEVETTLQEEKGGTKMRVAITYRSQAERGDFLIPRGEGAIADDHCRGELGDLLAGKIPGRGSNDEITLFKSLGIALEDLAAARLAYANAELHGLGRRLPWTAVS